MDYENLRQDYHETISMEQFYKIAHISKRKAKWLLENGIIPCEDSGKQTRRFRLHLTNVIEFLRQREAGALEGVVPVGGFTDSHPRDIPVQEYLDSEELTEYLLTQWQGEPDMLTVKQAAALCGYVPTSINRWVQEKQIEAVLYFGNNLISKESLATFLASPYGQSIAVQSVLHKELMADFCEEMQNSDMTFGVMSL